jgi:hypothetical protein
VWCWPGLDADHHFQGAPRTAGQAASRVAGAAYGTLLHFGFVLRDRDPTPALLAIATAGLFGVLYLLRNESSARWILTALAVAAGPLLSILVLRTWSAFAVSRYAYQSFAAVAVAVGGVVDLLLAASAGRAALRALIWLGLLVAAPVYFQRQKAWLQERVSALQEDPSTRRDYWIAWDFFFDRAAEEARESGHRFRLPFLVLDSNRSTEELFWSCNPRGTPWIVSVPHGSSHAADCVSFWRKVHETRLIASPFDRAPLPASMIILEEGEEVPPGEHLVCRVQSREGQPRLWRGADATGQVSPQRSR